MDLPHKDRVIVEAEEVRDYVLNEVHPHSYGKVQFFRTKRFLRAPGRYWPMPWDNRWVSQGTQACPLGAVAYQDATKHSLPLLRSAST
jgi:hypothetical protein